MPNGTLSSSPYQPAATILNQLWQQGSYNSSNNNHNMNKKNNTNKTSLKNLVFDAKTGQLKCSKTTYAQVCQVQKHLPILQAVVHKHIQKNHQSIQNEGLFYVLLYELLLGPNQSIRGGGQLKRQLMKYETKLRHYLQEETSHSNNTKNNNDEDTTDRDDDTNDTLPRYIRVNTCQTSIQEVVTKLRSLWNNDDDYEIYLDAHVPDVLVVPRKATALILESNQQTTTSKRNKQEEEKGVVVSNEQWNPQTSIVLQDKSSCFPALCLMSLLSTKDNKNSSSSFELIDACAAPGNKTTHLAALTQTIHPTVLIHAFDRDEKRHELLQRRCQMLVGNNRIHTKQQDFLTIDPADYPNVRGILLDPTCSGSGMRNQIPMLHHVDHHETETDHRLQKLSHFQYRVLLHACSFPQVEFIVYSTCSIHKEENEDVVHRVLSELSSSSSSSWYVVPPPALAHWTRRGVGGITTGNHQNEKKQPDEHHDSNLNDIEQHMIRVDPMHDETNGFFVCCLARTPISTKLFQKHASKAKKDIEKQARVLGLSLYQGQLRTKSKKTNTSTTKNTNKKEEKAKEKQPSGTKDVKKRENASNNTKVLPKEKKDNIVNKTNDKKKRNHLEMSQPSTTSKNKASVNKDTKALDSSTDETKEDKHSRKRAKRLEWKKKQREEKLKRLQVNQK